MQFWFFSMTLLSTTCFFWIDGMSYLIHFIHDIGNVRNEICNGYILRSFSSSTLVLILFHITDPALLYCFSTYFSNCGCWPALRMNNISSFLIPSSCLSNALNSAFNISILCLALSPLSLYPGVNVVCKVDDCCNFNSLVFGLDNEIDSFTYCFCKRRWALLLKCRTWWYIHSRFFRING